MSEYIALRPVTAVFNHPNADSLAVVKVGHFQVVHGLEEASKLKIGQRVVHFPTDICIDPDKAKELGVDRYCRAVYYKDQSDKSNCRIVAARLRGIASHGFIVTEKPCEDHELDEYYGVWKYEPPEPPERGGDVERDHPDFPKYHKIRRIQLNPKAWTEGLPVRVTEKIHGMNFRVGVVKENGEWRYILGTHNTVVKECAGDKRSKLWDILDENVMILLNNLCDGENTVVVYGERFGKGIQDLDYGYVEPQFQVFDIMVNGEFLDWDLVRAHCESSNVRTVPLLYEGSFSWCMVDNLTDGGSTVQNPSLYKSNFKGREGIVITPLTETFSEVLNNRLIAKSINVDYESRRGKTTEYH